MLRKVALGLLAVVVIAGPVVYGLRVSRRPSGAAAEPTSADVIVVGAGVGGLSAAWELSRVGAKIIVVDMSSVFGGHAVMATGELALVDTPYQREHGIVDSPDLAYRDFMAWGEDPDPTWMRRYVDHSRDEIYDWLGTMGVTWEAILPKPGASVARALRSKGRGIGLVTPIFQEVARRDDVSFRWNARVDRLLVEGGRVVGVAATSTRTGAPLELRARAVVLATGGFQSNLDLVRASWPAGLPLPPRLLAGSGWNSIGLGLDVARTAGAAVTRLDHQWNYITGLPDPRFPGANRGLNAYVDQSIWVNAEGRRFLRERSSPKDGLPVLARQTGGTYWSIFDEAGKRSFWVAGSDWAQWSRVEKLLIDDPAITKTAPTLDELAAKTGLPAAALRATLDHYNQMVDAGVDADLARFGPGKPFKPQRIERGPFYAAQFFPVTRKSLGGVAIDAQARALDGAGRPIPGLYAAGELTGFAGVNGRYGMEGTFLAPAILTGRVAGRAIIAELAESAELGVAAAPPAERALPAPLPPAPPGPSSFSPAVATCLGCHQLSTLVVAKRPGYWHFEKVHTVVLAKELECARCHAELGAVYDPPRHHIDRLAQPRVCPTCHAGEDR